MMMRTTRGFCMCHSVRIRPMNMIRHTCTTSCTYKSDIMCCLYRDIPTLEIMKILVRIIFKPEFVRYILKTVHFCNTVTFQNMKNPPTENISWETCRGFMIQAELHLFFLQNTSDIPEKASSRYRGSLTRLSPQTNRNTRRSCTFSVHTPETKQILK